MTASTAGVPAPDSLSAEGQAAALWTYVHLKVPRFTSERALQVVRQLSPAPDEEPKALAKRLRKELQGCGVALKHTHALHAASRLLGYNSWHANEAAKSPKLKFATIEPKVAEQVFSTWAELVVVLKTWCDGLLARSQIPLRVLQLGFSAETLNLSTPVAREGDTRPRVETWPLAVIAPVCSGDPWLDGAANAFESLRRHLEETGKAMLDGYAVLNLCANSHDWAVPGVVLQPVTVADTINSELVLVREGDEDDPHSGFEIARGDEMTCWHQLELSLRDDRTDELGDIRVEVPQEGVGAWFVNGVRYVWQLQTIQPHGYVPGLVTSQLGPIDCLRLERRYRLARRMHQAGLRHHEQTKRVNYLAGPPDRCRINLHYVLHQMNNAGLTWETYCERFQTEPLSMQAELPFGFVLQMLQNLNIAKPNEAFAQPNRSEMALVEDDSLIRALLPRVDFVRYVKPRYLEAGQAEELREAVEEFGTSLRMQKLGASGFFNEKNPLPYLVYASDGEELRTSAERLGLNMYAAAMPHLQSTEGLVEKMPNVLPWALGHALFLRFERRGGVQ